MPRKGGAIYDKRTGISIAIPFINNFMSSPFYKITLLGSTGKNHSTELTDYLLKNKLHIVRIVNLQNVKFDVQCLTCSSHDNTINANAI